MSISDILVLGRELVVFVGVVGIRFVVNRVVLRWDFRGFGKIFFVMVS